MNIEQLLHRHSSRANEFPDADAVDDLGGYGVLRGIRERAYAIEFRKMDGCVLAIPYAFIEQFVFSPIDGITVRAGGRDIRIRGVNLNDDKNHPLSLFRALTLQRVPWIAEQSKKCVDADPTTRIVEAICC